MLVPLLVFELIYLWFLHLAFVVPIVMM